MLASLAVETRSCAPSQTVALMRPHFDALGITRIARQTGLDRVGLPCFASIRPNSKTLAVNQGKGLTDDDAMASAVMEAVEFAIAERPRLTPIIATARGLSEAGQNVYVPRDLLPLGIPLDEDVPIRWVKGRGVANQGPVWVPLATVEMGERSTDLPGICNTTNGLASGNTLAEAVLHGLCELIERDANTLWYLSSAASKAETRIDPAGFGSPTINDVIDQIRAAGLDVRVFEQTCDTGVPVFMAAVATFGGAGRHFEVCSGYAANPDPVHAALHALCEASQSRITTIASSRDDIDPVLFEQPVDPSSLDLFRSDMVSRQPSICSALQETNDANIGRIARRLASIGISEPIVVDLAGTDLPCRVVRVLCPDLEDMGANSNWRPGPRALGALL